MITRRTFLAASLAAGTGWMLAPRFAVAEMPGLPLITRAIPRTGERLPVVGLGTSASVARAAGSGERDQLGAVLRALRSGGGRVLDTAPSYGDSEQLMGALARTAGLTDALFWATKLNVAAGGGRADAAAARAQLDRSLARIGKRPIDLVQVHNMGDPATQLPILREYQHAGRIRYVGITTTYASQYDQLMRVMRKEPLDFIGIDYALDNRGVEERILPLAHDRGIAVLVYAPFGRTRLWQTVRGRPLPAWASGFDAHSWAQFFLKFVVANPTVTATTPATSSAGHMADDLLGARGRIPDAEQRQRMIRYVEAL